MVYFIVHSTPANGQCSRQRCVNITTEDIAYAVSNATQACTAGHYAGNITDGRWQCDAFQENRRVQSVPRQPTWTNYALTTSKPSSIKRV